MPRTTDGTAKRLLRAAAIPLITLSYAICALAYLGLYQGATARFYAKVESCAVRAASVQDPNALAAIAYGTDSDAIPALLQRLGDIGEEQGIPVHVYVPREAFLYRVTQDWPDQSLCVFETDAVHRALGGEVTREPKPIRDEDITTARAYAPISFEGRIVAVAIADARTAPLTRTLILIAAGLLLIAAAFTVLMAFAVRRLSRTLAELEGYSRELSISEERFKLATEGSDTAIFDWDRKNGSFYASPGLLKMLGYTRDMPFLFDLLHEKDCSAHAAYLSALDDGTETSFEEELRFLSTNRAWRFLRVAGRVLRDAEGGIERITCSVHDTTEKREYEERIYHLAYTDTLTGLSNRTRFMEGFSEMLSAQREPMRPIALLCVDIDHFARYNDSHGSAAGDRLLKQTAECIRAYMPKGCLIARMQADAFYIALYGISTEKDARALCMGLKQEYAHMPLQQGGDIDITLSIGATLSPEQGTDIGTLMRNVDIALRVAKNMGRNGIRVFEKKMHSIAYLGRRIEQDLPGALEAGELELWYQPLVSSVSRRIERVLALPRWWHPRLGLITAGKILPVARELGLAATLEEWVVREAGEELKRLTALGGRTPRMTLVFSAAWLSPQLAAVLWREKQRGSLPLDRLEVLIVGCEDSHLDRAVIDAMRTMGVMVLIPRPDRATRASLLTAASLDRADAFIVDGIATELTLAQARGEDGFIAATRMESRMSLVCQPITGTALREALAMPTQSGMRKVETQP